ncbi:MAG TPA: CinA family protein [Legionellaceae bacterium]|nr:CinA family protein [Legionellaceae bacterium]
MAKHSNHLLITTLGDLLRAKDQFCTIAESCTGGLIAATITNYSGCSKWFDSAFITYSNEAKCKILGISPQLIQTHGAVSQETAMAMAQAALSNTQAAISVAVTGIAGPTGGTTQKPVGTIWFAWASHHHPTHSVLQTLSGSTTHIRQRCVVLALEGLIERAKLL